MSDKNLDQLIATLKTEGIESAEKEARQIIEAANSEAQEIKSAAEKDAQNHINQAHKQANAIITKGKVALQQAERDVTLSLKHDLVSLLQSTFEKEVRKGFNPDLIKNTISTVIANIGSNATIELPNETYMEIKDFIHDMVQNSEQELSIQVNSRLLEGMKIKNDKDGWSYEVTPESISEALQSHLTPNWLDILKTEE